MKQPTFSICIPNYNYAQYIGETIQSVLSQSCQDFEIIVADNASTDNSVAVVESFQDPRIRLIRNRYNIGFAPNLQRASETACGSYMLMLSSDDRMKANALETYLRVIMDIGDDAKHSILFSDSLTINSAGEANPELFYIQKNYYQDLISTYHDLSESDGFFIYSGMDVLRKVVQKLRAAGPFLTMLYPRSLYEAVQGYNSTHLTDPDMHFAYKLLTLEPQVIWVDKALFEYREHHSNQESLQRQQASIKKPIDKYMMTLEISDTVLKQVEVRRQELIQAFISRYCIDETFGHLASGAYKQSYSNLMFGLATYPGQVVKTPKAYLLAALLFLGPLSGPATRLVRNIFRRHKK